MAGEPTPFPIKNFHTGNAKFDLAIQQDQAETRLRGPVKKYKKREPYEPRYAKCELSGVARFANMPSLARCPSCGNIVKVRRPSGVIAWHSYKPKKSPSEGESPSTTDPSTNESLASPSK